MKVASTKIAILGLDPIQTDWISAIHTLTKEKILQPVAAGHSKTSAAKDIANLFSVSAFDDLRQMVIETTPQIILLDRPENASIDFLTTCVSQKIALFSLGPPVDNLAEAQQLSSHLEATTPYLYIWPKLTSSPAYAHTAQADEYVKPIRFATAHWQAYNHALAKVTGQTQNTVRSLSSLAWDALSTLIDLLGLPETVYAALRGNAGTPDDFADISGSASLTLRFAEDTTANLVLSDLTGPFHRALTLLGAQGQLHLTDLDYKLVDPAGTLIDQGILPTQPSFTQATITLRMFVEQLLSPPSPHRGTAHLLEETAATVEAMLVSHRTGSAESPARLLSLRR